MTNDSRTKAPPKTPRPSALHRAARWATLAGARLVARSPSLGATSAELCADPLVAAAFGTAPALALPGLPVPQRIVGWGTRASGRRAARAAARSGAQLLLLEDGFLRSARREDPPLSIVIDDLGIYHDARRPSRLERQIAAGTADADRAQRLIRLWRAYGLSKIARLPPCATPLPPRYVLVLDQVAGDASVEGGLAQPGSFGRMLQAARAEFPHLTLVLKAHPDTALRGRRGHFEPAHMPEVLTVSEACDPAPLLAGAEAVYTVTSQGGFEALLHGRPVRTFGMPFFGGWGLTEDDLPAPTRRGTASLEALVHAALVDYPRYLDPDTGGLTTVEATMERLARSATPTGGA